MLLCRKDPLNLLLKNSDTFYYWAAVSSGFRIYFGKELSTVCSQEPYSLTF